MITMNLYEYYEDDTQMSQLIEVADVQEVKSNWIFIRPFLGVDFDDIMQQYYNHYGYDEYKPM